MKNSDLCFIKRVDYGYNGIELTESVAKRDVRLRFHVAGEIALRSYRFYLIGYKMFKIRRITAFSFDDVLFYEEDGHCNVDHILPFPFFLIEL